MNTPASSIKFSLGSTPSQGPERPFQPTPAVPSPAATSSSKTHVNDAIRSASRRAFRGALVVPSPDPRIKSIEDQEADDLIDTIDLAIKRHRRSDVENWTNVICTKIIKSASRISAFASYLKQLSRINSLTEQTGAISCLSDAIHKLCFASDLQQRDASQFYTSIGGVLPDLFTSIVDSMPIPKDDSHDEDQLESLKALLKWWKSWDCLSPTVIEKLELILDQTGTNGELVQSQWVLPTTLGEPGTPWYDLPAANMLRFIKPNSKAPIRTRDIRPLVFKAPGEPDPELLAAVEALLLDVKRDKDDTHALDEGETVHFDRMGQRVYRDADGKPSRRQDTYYGWTPEFCVKMTARKNKIRNDRNRRSDSTEDSDRRERLEKRYGRLDRDDSRSRSRRRRSSSDRSRGSNYSRSRSSSRPPRKDHPRRRRSSSASRSRSRTRRQSHHTTTPGNAHLSNQKPMATAAEAVYPPYPNMNAQSFFNPNNPMFLPQPPPNWVGPWPPPPPPPPMPMPGMPFALPNGAPLPFPPPLPPPPMAFQQTGAPPFLPSNLANQQQHGPSRDGRPGQGQRDKHEFRR